jgi:hypothetical protein
MLRKAVKLCTPPILIDLARSIAGKSNSSVASSATSFDETVEYIDFWSNTSLFALEVLQEHGPLKQMRLFSLGNRMANLADYVGLFDTIYHCTTLKTVFPVAPENSPSKLVLLQEDFFDLLPLDIDCFISQAAIHCLNDSRYGNQGTNNGWARPYQAAAKLRQIIGNKSVPIVVSIAVHRTESLIDDNARLDHEKFVRSFADSGFSLRSHFFDYLCEGLPKRDEYQDVRYRRAAELPTAADASGPYNYVIGNYYFL